MKNYTNNRRRAFSLIELVIVIIIMGVISAIAIPRMMKGADNADVTALQADLAVLRSAIEMYRYEHGAFPDLVTTPEQLTIVTQSNGAAWVSGEKYGPYIVKIPPLKTGNEKGEVAFALPAATPPVAEVADKGWLYDIGSGNIWANDVGNLDK